MNKITVMSKDNLKLLSCGFWGGHFIQRKQGHEIFSRELFRCGKMLMATALAIIIYTVILQCDVMMLK